MGQGLSADARRRFLPGIFLSVRGLFHYLRFAHVILCHSKQAQASACTVFRQTLIYGDDNFDKSVTFAESLIHSGNLTKSMSLICLSAVSFSSLFRNSPSSSNNG